MERSLLKLIDRKGEELTSKEPDLDITSNEILF
jgi:hypothetical protein